MTNNYEGYDASDPLSIEMYAQKLIGKSFREIRNEDDEKFEMMVKESIEYKVKHENKNCKGRLGEIIEEQFFHYPCNNDSRPDFPDAGVELKVTPYKKNKNGSLSAKERLIITMIDYCKVIYEDFEQSHLWQKARLILLVYYLYEKDIQDGLDYRIGYSKLFSPPEQDRKIIQHDYETILSKIKEGKAHELSEGDTMYLGAAPKAATSKKRRSQPFSDIPAKPRAFAFKNSYMTYILNHYIIPGKDTYEPIIKDGAVDSFEEYVIQEINQYRGYSVDELCNRFQIDTQKKPKNLTSILAFKMLKLSDNKAEEFEKANIVVKAIRIEKTGRIKENMSFPVFKFKELVKEEWEDSKFGNYLRETRFLFVVYKFDKSDNLRLTGCQFWNIPYGDLENDVRIVWERTKQVISDGIQVIHKGNRRINNFPKSSENPVCHVRPHGQNARDVYDLPGGGTFTKQSFWLNNSYIYEQLNQELK